MIETTSTSTSTTTTTTKVTASRLDTQNTVSDKKKLSDDNTKIGIAPPNSVPASTKEVVTTVTNEFTTQSNVTVMTNTKPKELLPHAATMPNRLYRSSTLPINTPLDKKEQDSSEIGQPTVDVLSDDLPASMLSGIDMLVFKANKRRLKTYHIWVELAQLRIIIRSKKSNKERYINIESIKEYRVDQSLSQAMRDMPEMDASAQLCAFSIVYLDGSHYELLHVVPATNDVQVDWLTGLQILTLRYCHTRHEEESLVLKEQENVWLRRQWKLADKDGNQRISLSEFTRICQQMNMSLSKQDIKQHFLQAANSKENEIDYETLVALIRSLNVRHDLADIFYLYSKHTRDNTCHTTTDDMFMSREQFKSFIINIQKLPLSDTELTALMDVYSDETTNMITFDAFSRFLQSDDNPVHLAVNNQVWHNMKFPLCYYYIHSSHNTYLVGNQLTGKSSVDAYVFALENGCRCVELDCWDGPDGEPIVYHGYTLTSKISFQEIITVIKKHAFDRSPYPLILSLEVHCGLSQQERMASILINTLGDMLVSKFINPNETSLPSPHDLMHRILIKTKGLGKQSDGFSMKRSININASSSSSDEDAESNDESPTDKVKPTKFSRSLAALAVYCQTKHFVSFNHSQANDAIYEMCSFAESTGVTLAKKSPAAAIRHNCKHLSRIYPSGKRINSTNYDPVVHWGVGSQLVALNLQTYDANVQLNRAMFRQNGCCGYVLKPPSLCLPDLLRAPTVIQHTLNVKIISGQQLPKPKNSEGGNIIDPYCVVQLISPSDTQKETTKYVTDNGFNPIWNEHFSFKIDSVDLAFLRLSVWTKKSLTKSDVFLASFCVIINNLHTGYKHIPLRDYKGDPLLQSTLFICTELI